MVKQLLFIYSIVLLFSCKSKTVSLAGDTPVDAHDFIEYFKPLKTPVQFSDTSLVKKPGDSVEISHAVFTTLVPDSILAHLFSKTAKPHIYPIGKVASKKEEIYLFVKALTPGKKVLLVICFDHNEKFSAAKALIVADGELRGNSTATLDNKLTFTVQKQYRADAQTFYRKEAYVYNSAGTFTLILTESNEPKSALAQLYNPIDTLARKHKFSGDYVQDKRNIVSVRDGKDATRMQFFVHFEKEQGTCKGELKGDARFVSPTTAHYKSNGDGCEVEFVFTGTAVRMKELQGCGNHRDIKCFFEGSYERKKEPKPKPTRKKGK